MNRTLIIASAAALLVAACGDPSPRLRDHTDTLSWALGENIGQSLAQTNPDNLNTDLLVQAIRHTLKGDPQPIGDSAYAAALQELMAAAQQQASAPARRPAASPSRVTDVDKAQAQYFANLEKSNPNIKKHPSGFYYEVLKAGHGANATYAARIKFDYRSFLMLDGQPFDQTYGKRGSIVHVVGEPMFPGLIAAFQLMNAGSTYRFYFPYQLAFGTAGSGDIPPCTPLIYEIELHQIFDK